MDYKETKGLHEVVTSSLKDGDERNFCFLSIDVVGHSNKMQKHPSYALCHMNLGAAYWSKLDYDRALLVHCGHRA